MTNYLFRHTHPEDKLMKPRYEYIVIEGNIGSGKTSLARMMASEYDAQLVLERFADNPFLPLFYRQPRRYAFPLELSFLADRFQQLQEELTTGNLFHRYVVSDYILTKSLIFAGITLNQRENDLYRKLFNIINPNLRRPDLIVYLHKDVERLRENIRKRGREYEQEIEPGYLKKIEEGYWEFFRQHPTHRILVIDTNNVDFVTHLSSFTKILELTRQEYPPGLHRILLND